MRLNIGKSVVKVVNRFLVGHDGKVKESIPKIYIPKFKFKPENMTCKFSMSIILSGFRI